jgi:hypothetical protein
MLRHMSSCPRRCCQPHQLPRIMPGIAHSCHVTQRVQREDGVRESTHGWSDASPRALAPNGTRSNQCHHQAVHCGRCGSCSAVRRTAHVKLQRRHFWRVAYAGIASLTFETCCRTRRSRRCKTQQALGEQVDRRKAWRKQSEYAREQTCTLVVPMVHTRLPIKVACRRPRGCIKASAQSALAQHPCRHDRFCTQTMKVPLACLGFCGTRARSSRVLYVA